MKTTTKNKYRKLLNGMKTTTKKLTPKGFAIPTDLSRTQTMVSKNLWDMLAYDELWHIYTTCRNGRKPLKHLLLVSAPSIL
jgi:hypothetical protein